MRISLKKSCDHKVDNHIRMLETKFKEEQLSIQQNHNMEIKKVNLLYLEKKHLPNF